MELRQDIIDYCERQWSWDDDVRQDLYVKILEIEEPIEINYGWCVEVYNNMVKNNIRDEQNRARLREDNYDEIVKNLGLLNEPDDPQYEAEVDEDIVIKLNGLSAALRDTLIQYYVEGRSPEAIAALGNENVEAVRKRITRARNQLKENN